MCLTCTMGAGLNLGLKALYNLEDSNAASMTEKVE
jgi:hypothetical protein